MWQEQPPASSYDMSFAIASVDAFHMVAPDRTYWDGFQSQNRRGSDRFDLKPGWRTVYSRQVESAIVKVTLADGSIGWGEATEPICPEVICRLAAGLLAPLLGNVQYSRPSQLWDEAYDIQRGRGHIAGYHLHAMAALDVAVWDALARRNGVPLSALISEAPRDAVTVYLSGLRRRSRQERVELLKQMVGDGLTAVKIFTGGDTEETLAEMEALRSGVPGSWDLMVDTLWSYDSVEQAVYARRAFADFGTRWLECPLVPEDLDGHRELSQGPGVDIALGEHFFTHYQNAPWLAAKALHMLQPDIGRTGISDGLRQADLARRSGIGVTPHMGSGSPVVHATALHFWAGRRGDAPCEFQLDLSNLFPDVFRTDWRYNNGRMDVPSTPGLGVHVDEAALERRSASVDRWRPARS